jgi:hypothetical protein
MNVKAAVETVVASAILASAGSAIATEYLAGCSQANQVFIGGNGTSPATQAQTWMLIEARKSHPDATLCSGVKDGIIVTYIQWAD